MSHRDEGPVVTSPEIRAYLEELHPDLDPILAGMYREGKTSGFPLLSRISARILAQLVRVSGARQILELGSGFGWSALWMARAMPDGGRILLTDSEPKNTERARDWFEKDGRTDQAEFLTGDALEILDRDLGEPFDLIFLDIDKESYQDALERGLPLLRPGGLWCSDNTLWHGLVASKEPHDERTRAVLDYNRRLMGEPGLVSLVLPAGDGLSVSVKAAS